MRQYIKKLQSKREDTRKQIFAGAMIVSMSIVGLIWVYSLGVRFGNPKVAVQANEDIKPFKLFSNTLSSTFQNIGASVGSAPRASEVKKEEPVVQDSQKQIDLIPVENTN